jgi:two-component system, OmpR family, sensor histidine kinase KdpD
MLAVLKSLVLVGITTIGLLILDQFFALRHVTLVYLVPVVVAATKLGIAPAVIAAIASVGASAFFFYPPIYSFLVHDPQHLIELPLFVFVAIVTGHLATNLRRQADLARRREIEVHDLHVLSRRLAAAHTPGDIHTAIRQHRNGAEGWSGRDLQRGDGARADPARHRGNSDRERTIQR